MYIIKKKFFTNKKKSVRPFKRWNYVQVAGKVWPRRVRVREDWQSLEEAYTVKVGPYLKH